MALEKTQLKINLAMAITLLTVNYSAIATESQPPLELNRLEYFEGNWRCQQPAAPAEPSGVFT